MGDFEELEDKVDELESELSIAKDIISELQDALFKAEEAIGDVSRKARNY